MGGHDDCIKQFTAGFARYQYALRATRHLDDRRIEPHVANTGAQFFDILARAAFDGQPLRPVIDLQQTVIQAEL